MAILVSGSCLGSVNINIFTTGKLTVAAAQHGYFPRFLVNMESEETIPRVPFFLHWAPKIFGDHVFQNTPIVAMAFNAMCTCVFITVGTFNSLITFIGLAEYTFAFLTVAGLLRLRRTQPKLLRPYKPPTLIPLVFTIIAGLLTLRGILFAPIQAALLVLLVGFGGLAHWNKSKGENAWKWPKLMAG